MILGMTPFTAFHVILSLLGIGSGLLVAIGWLGSRRLPGLTLIFLLSTIATSVTGFFFPFQQLLPSHIVGILSLAILAVSVLALYVFHLAGAWRWVFVATATMALYLNVFVLVVQLFLKVPALHELAPTQKELPFVLVQGVVLILFVALGARAVRRFYPTI